MAATELDIGFLKKEHPYVVPVAFLLSVSSILAVVFYFGSEGASDESVDPNNVGAYSDGEQPSALGSKDSDGFGGGDIVGIILAVGLLFVILWSIFDQAFAPSRTTLRLSDEGNNSNNEPSSNPVLGH